MSTVLHLTRGTKYVGNQHIFTSHGGTKYVGVNTLGTDTGMLALNKLVDSFGAGLPQKFNLLPFSCLGQVN